MKICIRCKKEKKLSEFYVHKQMKDGHLNKCIDCCKEQAKDREKELRQNPEYIINERSRGRDKYKRLYTGSKPTSQIKAKSMANYLSKFPEKYLSRNKSQRLKAIYSGNNLHHWNYGKGFEKDVIELRPKLHYLAHRFMVYDQERMMYRTLQGELLDTKQRHYDYILNIFRTKIKS